MEILVQRFRSYLSRGLQLLLIPVYFIRIRIYFPFTVAHRERIVRAIFSPYHIDKKKKRLRPAAFRPPSGDRQLSVMRRDYMGVHACHNRAKSLTSPKTVYEGVAIILASSIRSFGPEIHDCREDFLGHAHISYDFTIVANEPLPPEELLLFNSQIECLLSASKY